MNKQYIYELFKKEPLENIIEVFDCYDSQYGKIYYQGNLVSNFYKESYYDILKSHKVINIIKKMECNLNQAQIIIYTLEPLRDYQNELESLEPSSP